MEKKMLGLNLLELRQSRNLTQKQLCEALNIGRSTYSYFETGTRMPDIETLLLIARYYHVSLDKLVDFDLEQDPAQKDSDNNFGTHIIHHLKSRRIPIESVLELSKADFDFLSDYKKLTDENKEELQYLVNYKLRKQFK